MTSPYERALGDRRALLHPAIQSYFSTIPDGHVGIGTGEFDSFGPARRWVSYLMRPFEAAGVLSSQMHSNVPFRIFNRTIAGRAVADRIIELPAGTWRMTDTVSLGSHGRIVDHIGEPWLIAVSFDIGVEGGALQMESYATGVRWRTLRLRMPRFLSPRVRLVERFEDASGRHHVDLVMTLPLIGRIYGYSGYFTYRIEEDS